MLGMSEATLLNGTGLAQLIDDVRHKRDIKTISVGSIINESSIYDQMEDQASISLGIQLWYTYGADLTKEIFIEALVNAEGIKKR